MIMTATFGVLDARSRFSELIERAERGEEIVVTKHGQPVARIVPVAKPGRTPEEAAEIVEAARRLRDSIRAECGTTTHEEIRAWIDEDRP